METTGRHNRLTRLLVSNNGKCQQVMGSLEEEKHSGSLLPSPSTAPSVMHRSHSSLQAAFLLQTLLSVCFSNRFSSSFPPNGRVARKIQDVQVI